MRCRASTAVFDAVDVRDVRMVQRGKHLRLAAEARQAIGIIGDRRQQDFDRDVAMSIMGTDRMVRGRAAVRSTITYFHEQAFRTHIAVNAGAVRRRL